MEVQKIILLKLINEDLNIDQINDMFSGRNDKLVIEDGKVVDIVEE